jgi:hypothetical protein
LPWQFVENLEVIVIVIANELKNYWVFPVSGSPKKIFNETLQQAGIPLSKD